MEIFELLKEARIGYEDRLDEGLLGIDFYSGDFESKDTRIWIYIAD